MKVGNDCFDTVVIGAGIAGLGVAGALRDSGASVLLLEKSQVSRATSAASLRIIHGGFRYLQSFDLPRLFESLRDQSALLRHYPKHLQRLPCLLPVQRWGLKSRWPMSSAALMYNIFSTVVTGRANGARIVKGETLAGRLPQFLTPTDRFLYWNDVLLLDPINFAEELKSDLIEREVVVVEGAFVGELCKAGDLIEVMVEHGGEQQRYRAKTVVNTTGPWLQSIKSDLPQQSNYPRGWCKAFNLILKRQYEPDYAVGIWGPQGRSFFLVPRQSQSVLGTWYQPFQGEPDRVAVSRADIAQFIACFNRSDFKLKLAELDVADYEVGVLPMRQVGKNGPLLYGIEKIFEQKGYVQVLSTKYTTYQSQARKVVRKLRYLL